MVSVLYTCDVYTEVYVLFWHDSVAEVLHACYDYFLKMKKTK